MIHSTPDVFEASSRWKLSSNVSLRDESFGALAYHHGNRRLVFLKSTTLVAIVERLEEFESVDAALDAMVSSDERVRYTKALAGLAASEILSEC